MDYRPLTTPKGLLYARAQINLPLFYGLDLLCRSFRNCLSTDGSNGEFYAGNRREWGFSDPDADRRGGREQRPYLGCISWRDLWPPFDDLLGTNFRTSRFGIHFR